MVLADSEALAMMSAMRAAEDKSEDYTSLASKAGGFARELEDRETISN